MVESGAKNSFAPSVFLFRGIISDGQETLTLLNEGTGAAEGKGSPETELINSYMTLHMNVSNIIFVPSNLFLIYMFGVYTLVL